MSPAGEVAAREQLAEVEPVGPAAVVTHRSPSSGSALARLVGGQRVEPGHQLLDLGPGPAQPPVELVDQRGRPLQAGHQHVDVDLALLEEARRSHRAPGWPRCSSTAPPGRRPRSRRSCRPPRSPRAPSTVCSGFTPGCPRPGCGPSRRRSASRSRCRRPRSPALRTRAPSAVRVRLYPRSSWRSTS